MQHNPKILISGGGTGGHIFPAVAIADAIKEINPNAEILFVGAKGRMEMEKIPAAGYKIVGLPISGFVRKNLLKNIPVVINLIKSIFIAKGVINRFKPDVAVGVGGYASGPTLWVAGKSGIPTVIQEQNSYAGVTNKLLAKRATAICVAYQNMERFFPEDKIILTGNPVRPQLTKTTKTRKEAAANMGVDPAKRTILVIGGSLGARTVNNSVAKSLDKIPNEVQLIWQTGAVYNSIAEQAVAAKNYPNIKQQAFITNMEDAYLCADLVISRAGASSISELSLLGKSVILVPSPNVAEDHQTKNAEALSNKGAAILIKDSEAETKLINIALSLINNSGQLKDMQEKIKKLAQLNSSTRIAEIVLKANSTES